MKDFLLPISIPISEKKISHQDQIILLGSCFSDEMSAYFKRGAFQEFSNPFGTIFHPYCIANQIIDAISLNKKVRSVKRNDLFFDYESGGKLFAKSEEELISLILDKRDDLHDQLKKGTHLFITFGSAFAYRLHADGKLVANCHKQKTDLFTKELSDTNEIIKHWKLCLDLLKSINPNICIHFTVSPVRHSKEGLPENNRSKGRLIDIAHQLADYSKGKYFPSYEIMMDHLRDYRFYKQDRIHPNEEALDYIWEQIQASYFSPESIMLLSKISAYQKSKAHQFFYPESEEAQTHREKLATLKVQIVREVPTFQF
jgi:hypothetical protein